MQSDATDQLHIEVAHVEHALASFADHRKRFGQHLFQGFTARAVETGVRRFGGRARLVGFCVGLYRRGLRDSLEHALAKLVGFRAQLLVREARNVGLQRVDLPHRAPILLQQPLIAAAEDFLQNSLNHGLSLGPGHRAESAAERRSRLLGAVAPGS